MDKTRQSLSRFVDDHGIEFRIYGADESPNLEDKNQDDQQEQDPNEKSSEKQGEKYDSASKDRKIAALEEEKARHFTRRKEAEDELAEAKREIEDLKKNGSKDEALKQELAEAKKEIASLKREISDLNLKNAFLEDNTYKWRDPKAALKLVDLKDVEFDEKTSSVHGLKDALEKLAKDSPYLLEEEKEDKRKKLGDPGKSREESDTEKSRQVKTSKLRSKYPGLRR